ncbi:MAG: immunity 17 family protein [Porphyromonas sp.]|nr:immunity 17 family protein [Bacteroidales bacterium]MDY3100201.1 immunity 17 family protein [Porphyromonas sp.]
MNPATLIKAVAILLFMAPGLLSLAVAVAGCRWFLESRSASTIRSYFGRDGARLFYGTVGLLLIVAGAVILLDPMRVFSAP